MSFLPGRVFVDTMSRKAIEDISFGINFSVVPVQPICWEFNILCVSCSFTFDVTCKVSDHVIAKLDCHSEHVSTTAVICTNFQDDLAIEINVLDAWDFPRFGFGMRFEWIYSIATGFKQTSVLLERHDSVPIPLAKPLNWPVIS